MQLNISNINVENWDKTLPIKRTVSLKYFIDYLDKLIAKNPLNVATLKSAYDRLQAIFKDGYHISENEIEKYKEAYELVYTLSQPPIEDEVNNYWGISIPFTKHIIYSTDGFSKLMNQSTNPVIKHFANASNEDVLDINYIQLAIIYSLFLKRHYNFHLLKKEEVIVSLTHDNQEHEQYYAVNFDSSFLQIFYDGALPQNPFEGFDFGNISREEALLTLTKIFPIENMRIEGISILKIVDVTTAQLTEKLKYLLMEQPSVNSSHEEIANTFKGIIGNYNVDILLLPILEMNQQIITDLWDGTGAELRKIQTKYNLEPTLFSNLFKEFVQNPQIIFHHNIKQACLSALKSVGELAKCPITGIIINPVFSHDKLVGAIALFSEKENDIKEETLARLEGILPLMEKLFESTINSYTAQLDRLIKNKFTSIQSAVEWKFNEVAIDYLKELRTDEHPQLKPIQFKNVTPIYGAIDIRNSTLERNKAQNEDFILQIDLLVGILDDLYNHYKIEIIGELIFRAKEWKSVLSRELNSDEDTRLNQFLDNEIVPFLTEMGNVTPEFNKRIDTYFKSILPEGSCRINARAIEKTFKILNSSIALLLDQMNDRIQEIYPCFFERFRSDGLEYNIYMGQSINPDKVYNNIYLKNLQLWQVSTMAVIAKNTEELQPKLPKSLRTTQLIFIHPNTIDINFRIDEHRFDVEGSYNVRYEVIKKRIDKAMVKGTGERLTQPGKIAIVYSMRKDVEEYITHIKYLQSRNIIAPEMEELDIEDLQGVVGLKAIRISILSDKKINSVKHNYLKETENLVKHQ